MLSAHNPRKTVFLVLLLVLLISLSCKLPGSQAQPSHTNPPDSEDEFPTTTEEQIYLPLITATPGDPPSSDELIQPENLTYLGAFRLPADAPDEIGWKWSNWSSGLTYYPDGDPDGESDGYPGSLFGVGHE